MNRTCLIVQPIHPAGVSRLTEAGVTPVFATAQDMATVKREIADAVAVITRDAGLDRAAIDAGTCLRVIANHGIGTNKIDVDHAHAAGIPIVFTPTANARSVAEHTLMLVLTVAKRTLDADRAARAGDWGFKYSGGMIEISGKTLGLIGFGNIARLVAGMAMAGFGMRVQVWSPRATDDDIAAVGAKRVHSLLELLRTADVVSLHRPARPDTRHTIDARALGLMKSNAILVNTARGPLVDEPALVEALSAGHLAGAGLDVFETEPLPKSSPLRSAPRVVLAPHVAGSTEDALMETAVQCAEQILHVLQDRRPAHLVDPTIWERRRVVASSGA